jgi:predicted ATP-binding protein involved in virulence
VLDEAELYYHPEYQRKYVKMLLDTLSWCRFSNDKIKSINIIIVTHSPFILSDMVRNNVLYLEGGEPKQREGETFGANFYDMLYNSFFFEKNAIGEIASETIKQLMQHPDEMTEALKDIIGDPLIRGYLINKAKRNV